jgi:hypothetical protein
MIGALACYPAGVAEAVLAWAERPIDGIDMLLAAVLIGVIYWAARTTDDERGE